MLPTVVTPELKSSLVKVLGLLKDAAESFAKVRPCTNLLPGEDRMLSRGVCPQDACVRQANRCVRTAKLVALQLHLLDQDSHLRVINLQPAELLPAIMSLPRCYQVGFGRTEGRGIGAGHPCERGG